MSSILITKVKKFAPVTAENDVTTTPIIYSQKEPTRQFEQLYEKYNNDNSTTPNNHIVITPIQPRLQIFAANSQPGSSRNLKVVKSPRSNPVKRKLCMDIDDKLNIIEMLNKGRSVVSLAKEFGIGIQTIRDWIKSEERLLLLQKQNKNSNQDKKILRDSDYPELEECLFK
jgi:hypothetical protein